MTNSHDKNKTLHRCTFSVWCAFRREDPWNSVATSARHLLHPSVLKKFTPLWREFRLEYDASSGYRLHYLLNMMAERWRSWEVSGKIQLLIARVRKQTHHTKEMHPMLEDGWAELPVLPWAPSWDHDGHVSQAYDSRLSGSMSGGKDFCVLRGCELIDVDAVGTIVEHKSDVESTSWKLRDKEWYVQMYQSH